MILVAKKYSYHGMSLAQWELYKALAATVAYMEGALLLNDNLRRCPHCDGTGKSAETFDRLCPHCTAPHCVVCDARDDLKNVMTFRLCGACEEIERRES